MRFEFFVSRRYIKSKRKQAFISLITLLSMIGITVGVMVLIVVISVMSGAEADLRDRILSVEPHIVVTRLEGFFYDYRRVIQMAEEIEGVVSARPFIYSQAMLRSRGGISGAVLKGGHRAKPLKNLSSETMPKRSHEKSDLLTKDGTPGTVAIPRIALGKELAKNLKANKGDMVSLISSGGKTSRSGLNPVMKRFVVSDIFESGLYEYDKTLAYIELKDAQRILGGRDMVTGIEVRVTDIDRTDKITEQLNKKTGFAFWVRDWRKMNRNLFLSLKIQKTTMYIILALIVLVAAFNIASTLIMMVMEKTRDIAILKTMGASNRSIRKIFVFKGMIIGFIGTVLGVCLGFILCVLLKQYQFIDLPGDVYYFNKLPVKLESLDVLIITSATLLICFLASLYPSYKASKLDPVEGIRYNG